MLPYKKKSYLPSYLQDNMYWYSTLVRQRFISLKIKDNYAGVMDCIFPVEIIWLDQLQIYSN